MVIDGSKVETETHLQVVIIKQGSHNFLDFIEAIHLLFIGYEHVCVDLVDKYFVVYVLVQCTSGLDNVSQLNARCHILLLLGINHVYEAATVLYRCHIILVTLFKLLIPWEIFNGKLDVWVIVDLCVIPK